MTTSCVGERLPAAGDPDFAVDHARHLAAYAYASTHAAGRRVLDAGCGEGYGASLIAQSAREVVALDHAAAVLARVGRHEQGPALHLVVAALQALPLHSASFDLALNFQVVEHLQEPHHLLAELARVLRPGGLLLLTTPNRLRSVSENPYHVREYDAAELRDLLARHFDRAEVLGVHGSERVRAYEAARGRLTGAILRLDPLGLRRRLPPRLVDALFMGLARLVRRHLRRLQGTGRPVGPEDFVVKSEGPDDALDLLAICRRR